MGILSETRVASNAVYIVGYWSKLCKRDVFRRWFGLGFRAKRAVELRDHVNGRLAKVFAKLAHPFVGVVEFLLVAIATAARWREADRFHGGFDSLLRDADGSEGGFDAVAE